MSLPGRGASVRILRQPLTGWAALGETTALSELLQGLNQGSERCDTGPGSRSKSSLLHGVGGGPSLLVGRKRRLSGAR